MKRLVVSVMVAALALVACRKKPKPAPAPEIPTSAAPEIPASAPCESLTRLECYRAAHCVLENVAPARYVCREPKGPCEVGLKQTDSAACNARWGCEHQTARCYCPFPGYGETAVPERSKNTGGACACGGGSPPMCAPKPSARDPR